MQLVATVTASLAVWNQTYGGTEPDIAYVLIKTSEGGFAMAGSTDSFEDGSGDFWLVKTDSYGHMEWNQTYGGTEHDCAYTLIETSDGGYAIAGTTSSFGADSHDVWLVKTDGYGNMEWNQTYGCTEYDCSTDMLETSDGGYVLTGYSAYILQNFWLIKTDAYGNVEWNQTYGEGEAHSLILTSDGGYAIAGGPWDFWLVKTDIYGNIEWSQTYGGEYYDCAYTVIEASDGGYVLTGETNSFGAGLEDCWLIKTNKEGQKEWEKTYGGSSIDRALSVLEASDEGYVIAGETHSFDVGQGDVWLIKTDVNGNVIWNQTYGGECYDCAYTVIETSGGGFSLAGYTSSSGAGSHDFWLIKTDSQGIPEFPSWAVFPIVLVATFTVIAYKKKLTKKR